MARTVPDDSCGLVATALGSVQTDFRLVLEAFNGVCRGMGAPKTTQTTSRRLVKMSNRQKSRWSAPHLDRNQLPDPAFTGRRGVTMGAERGTRTSSLADWYSPADYSGGLAAGWPELAH